MSNLLEQASLVMIPSGYKEDIVYSVIPTSGAGDLTFTRASNGTRVNSAGLVEVCPWNLLQYSENFTSGWITVNSSITANSTTAPNGTTTADTFTLTASSDSSIYQPVNGSTNNYSVSIYAKYVSGDKYLYIFSPLNSQSAKVWFDIQNGTVSNQSSGFTGTIENAGNGWYRCSLYNTNQAVLDYIQLGISTTNSSRILSNNSVSYIWGAQINTGTLKPYFPTTDRLNVPRLTYQNGGGGCPSLLLEKQSTNGVYPSEDFTNANWQNYGGASVTANTAISPDGTQNADTLDSGTSTALYNPNGVSGGAIPFTASIYVKKVNFEVFRFGMTDDTLEEFSYNYNLDTGVVSAATTPSVWTSTSGTITSVGNGWYRLTVTGTKGVSGVARMVVKGQSTSKQYYIWGAQLEASSYATSYIPTTSSSATRVADACYKTGISSLIGQTEGTLFVDCVILGNSGVENRFSISDGTTNNWIFIGTPEDATNGGSRFYIRTNASTHVDVGTAGYFTTGQRYKLALAYKSGNWAVYGNGTLLFSGTNSIDAVSSSLSAFNFFNYTGGSAQVGEQVNEAILFTTRLTNSELAQLTGNQNYTINQAYESYGVASESPNCVQP